MEIVFLGIGVLLAVAAISWVGDNFRRASLYNQLKPRLDTVEKRENTLKYEKETWTKKVEEEKSELEILAKEKSKGFPWLANAYADYHHIQALKEASWLEIKSHPAQKAADKVREIAGEKRETEKLWRTLKYQIEYYETLFPWLADFKDEGIDDIVRQVATNQNKSDFFENDDNDDPAKHWLTDAEYSSLSSIEKYQRALDRYYLKRKSKWEIGRDYERFIGFQYENQGWQVKYQGIVEGFADLGRDLIVTRGNEVQVVQCKYWTHRSTIHEKHIFQLYGTSIAYQIDNPNLKVRAVFVTSTVLSDRAKRFANFLGVSFRENKSIEQYPCIKCNVSRKDGSKIYHLPFDQQYDTTIVEPARGEKYVATVQEAENLGFRRAFRWRGS